MTDAERREKVLIDALLEIRDLVSSGSAEMAIVDEAVGQFGYEPWKRRATCPQQRGMWRLC
jgi:hypothetical protein